jgi:hypothetical protein
MYNRFLTFVKTEVEKSEGRGQHLKERREVELLYQ